MTSGYIVINIEIIVRGRDDLSSNFVIYLPTYLRMKNENIIIINSKTQQYPNNSIKY